MIELLVVVLIMGAAAAMALPMIGRTMNSAKVNRASSVVVSTLREANAVAGRRRRPVRVSIDTAQRVIRIRDHVAPDTVFRQTWFNGDSELNLESLAVSDTQLVVFPNGLRTKQTGWPYTITIRIAEHQRVITMLRGGQTRVTNP